MFNVCCVYDETCSIKEGNLPHDAGIPGTMWQGDWLRPK